jgi:hypothetical protein
MVDTVDLKSTPRKGGIGSSPIMIIIENKNQV